MWVYAPGHEFTDTDAVFGPQKCMCDPCGGAFAEVLFGIQCVACLATGAIAVCRAKFCYQEVVGRGLVHNHCPNGLGTIVFSEPLELPKPEPEQVSQAELIERLVVEDVKRLMTGLLDADEFRHMFDTTSD